jgi:DNA-binding transcriptional LysR family regulator
MDFTLRQLIYADAAAQFGNFTDAARHLGVSQASISTVASDLERRMGVKLYKRSKRGVTLTPAGERFIHEVRLLLVEVAKFQHTTTRLKTEQGGEIRIGYQIALAVRFLPELLARFAQDFPALTLEVEEGTDRNDVIAALLAGKIEFGLGIGQASDERVVSEELAALPPHAIVAVSHPSATRKSISLADLTHEPFLQLISPEFSRYVRRLFKLMNVEPRILYRSISPDLIRTMASRGLGFAIENIVPASTISHDGHRFAAVPFADPMPSLPIMAYRLKAARPSAGIRVFEACIRETFPAIKSGSIRATRVIPRVRRTETKS